MANILTTYSADKEQLEIQAAIVEQANLSSNSFRVWRANRTKEALDKHYGDNKKLTLLIDPTPIVEKVEPKKTDKSAEKTNAAKPNRSKWWPKIFLHWRL